MEYNDKANLKEQNSSRLTDSKKRLGVTKGDGWEWVHGGRRGLKGILIGTHSVCVWSRGRQCSTEKTSSDSVASHYTDGQ